MKRDKPPSGFSSLRWLERIAVRREIFAQAKTQPELLDDLAKTLDDKAGDNDFVTAAVGKYLKYRTNESQRIMSRN